jgi:hypothetical protein
MTSPRSDVVIPDQSHYYHCVSRCVRRAFLCGEDRYSGMNYDHRREWVQSRMFFLVNIFAIELVSYAVMSNHCHTLLFTQPAIAESWHPEEVARRWRLLFPLSRLSDEALEPTAVEISQITSNPEMVSEYRKRLSSISWFHRCLNENIARRANLEDGCKGRFWEGRFHSTRIDDIGGVVACSVYIDLNPVRATIAETPESSDFTSIQDRIVDFQKIDKSLESKTIEPFCKRASALKLVDEFTNGTFSLTEYLELVDNSGRDFKTNKGSISDHLASLLEKLQLRTDSWLTDSLNVGQRFKKVIGSVSTLEAAALMNGKRWLHGKSSARKIFRV